ncbi:hypothetical protein MKX01_017823 [Papaver californicum]|nr:hypothetical protein MKX01_017823 [Papaver californicum]
MRISFHLVVPTEEGETFLFLMIISCLTSSIKTTETPIVFIFWSSTYKSSRSSCLRRWTRAIISYLSPRNKQFDSIYLGGLAKEPKHLEWSKQLTQSTLTINSPRTHKPSGLRKTDSYEDAGSIVYCKLNKDKTTELLQGKKVVVIGYKKSAINLANECAEANQGPDGKPCTMVIMTLHRTVPSYSIWGLPFFLFYSTRFSQFLHERPNQSLLKDLFCLIASPMRKGESKFIESYLEWKLPLHKYGLKPSHPFEEDYTSCQMAIYRESGSNLHSSEIRCKWLSRALDGHFKLPTIENMLEQISKEIQVSKRSTRFYKKKPCISKFSINHTDDICVEMGLKTWRKKNWFFEAFSPYNNRDYEDLCSISIIYELWSRSDKRLQVRYTWLLELMRTHSPRQNIHGEVF